MLRLLWIAFAIMLTAGCGGDSSREGDAGTGDTVDKAEARAVLTDRAVVLDEAELAALERAEPSGEQLELTFSESSERLDELEVGDVLILGATGPLPNGALLEIDEVMPSDAGPSVLAHRAELGAAFEELDVQLEVTFPVPQGASGASQALTSGVAASREPLTVALPYSFRGDDNASELSGSLAVNTDIGIALEFSFEEGLSELSFRIDAGETFTADLVATGSSSFEETVELFSRGLTPITVIVPIPAPPGTVPVMLYPRIVLEAGVSGGVQGEAQVSVLQDADFSAGLGYQDGEFGDFSDSSSTFQVDPPTFEGGASLRAWAGPRAEVLLYGAVGPFITTQAFIELAAQVEGPPPCVTGVVNAGITVDVGVDLLADYRTRALNEGETLGSFDSCNEDDPDAPQPAITWSRTYAREGSPSESARGIIEASDGTFIVAGHSDLYDGVRGFAASWWVMRLDALGNVIWQRAYQRADLGLVRGLVEIPDGFLIAGNAGVMKLDSGGNQRWARTYSEDTPIEIASIAAQADGRSVVAGYAGTETRAWAMGLDEDGETLWSRSFVGEDIGRVRSTADGGYVLSGKITDAFDASVIKLDADGEVQWARMVDNLFDPNPEEGDVIATSDDRAFDIAEKPDGGYVLVGEAYGNFPLPEPQPVGFYGTWVVELDADGDFGAAGSVTHRAPIDGVYGGAYAVAVRPDGTSLIVGRGLAEDGALLSTEDILVVQGLGYSVIGGPGNDTVAGGTLSGLGRGMPLALTADGGAILAATSDSFSDRSEIWLIKLNRTGSINIPERSSIQGTSFTNGAAQSTPLEAGAADVPVAGSEVTLDVAWETTDVVVSQQAP